MSAQGLKPPAASEVSREDGELPVLVTQHVDFPSESAALGPAAHAEGPRGRCSPSHSVGLGCSPGAGTQGAPPRRLPWPPDSPPFVLLPLCPLRPLSTHTRHAFAWRSGWLVFASPTADGTPSAREQNARAQSQPYRDVPDPDPPPTARLLLCRAGRARWRVSEVPPAPVACGSAPTSPDRVQRHGSFKHPSPTRSGSSGSVQSL